MVASDVAARGLDIPLVEHVIHYQLPRSGDVCVLISLFRVTYYLSNTFTMLVVDIYP